MLKVLHVIETMGPHEGGPPRVVAGLSVAQRGRGIDAQILCGDGARLPEYLRYWQAHAPGFSSQNVHSVVATNMLSRAAALHRWLRAHLAGFDVVHIHQLWRLVPTLVALACRRLRVPYLLAPHTSLSPWALGQKRAKKALAGRLVWDRLFREASGFHALNELEAAEIRELMSTGGPPVFVVSNGVSLAEFPSAPRTVTQTSDSQIVSPIGSGKPFILFLARLHTMKGPDLLLDAFASIAQERHDLQLVFAGPDFGMLDFLQRRVAQLQLADRVHFLGLVSGGERHWLLQNAICLCQPSRDEGFSLSILEAMASSCSVVISDRCKFPEVAKHDAGIIVPLSIRNIGTALNLYAGDEARRRADGRCARLLIERSYTWEIVSEGTEHMYAQAIQHTKGLAHA